MNLKRSIATAFAAVALTLSLAAPVAMADNPVDLDSSATVNEGGAMTYSLWSSAISFSAATVTTYQSQTAAGTSTPLLAVDDSHSSSDGFILQMTATDLVHGDYFIEAKNVSVALNGISNHSAAACFFSTPRPSVGGNAYQTLTRNLGSTTIYSPLSSAVTLITAGEGRGCGLFHTTYKFQLEVPAGTYTGGGSAVYTGSIVISNVGEPD